MKSTAIVVGLASLAFVAGCSSLPQLPSISLPWSSAPQPDPNADAIFNRGMELFNSKRYVAALDQFNKIKQEFPFAPQALEAELKIGECYYLNQQYPEAIAAFQEFQSMHPTNEQIPFVTFRLGLAHFDQFSATDRDQKNTEIAKGYFETVIKNYPKSPYAKEAKEKLAKSTGYLADHDFNIAYFYFQQEKYAAARDRFEEIVRRYPGTPVAARSLFYLGESYRKEKNSVKAALAYEAIIQHYPESKFVNDAKTQLASLEKEKHDPLAMLLMRDRRPSLAPASQNGVETASAAKLKDVDNLVAKTEVVYEEPGQEKGIFRRVVDKVNPFSSSDDGKKSEDERKKSESDAALQALAKKKSAEKSGESTGILASLWPFGSQDAKEKKIVDSSKKSSLVARVDDSLKGKGIDTNDQLAVLQPPPSALSEIVEEPVAPRSADTAKLLGQIDSDLKTNGKAVEQLPPPPQAAEVFNDPAAVQALAAKKNEKPEAAPSIDSTGLLGSIDDKLKSKGVEAAKFELPTSSPDASQTAAKKPAVKKVELEPKITVEKGPLFLEPSNILTQDNATSEQESSKEDKTPSTSDKSQDSGTREIPKALVRGPAQPQPATPTPKPAEQKKSTATGEDEEKGVMDQLKEDAESISKILNPFRW